VDSAAAVKLITKAFAELTANPSLGRAEAMRRSMLALINDDDPSGAHPTYWAPMALVGEGAER
jgi:CHAT domain-containing protein